MKFSKRKLWLKAMAAALVIPLVFTPHDGANAKAKPPEEPIEAFLVDKARYTPGEAVTMSLLFDAASDWQGSLHLEVYHLNEKVAEGKKNVQLKKGMKGLEIKWTPPKKDLTGYMVKAYIEGTDQTVTAAVDVSSDWTHFPRYGYTTEFPRETPEESEAKMKELTQEYYMNGFQFYDWMWRHDVPVYSKTDEKGNPIKDENGDFIAEELTSDTAYDDLLGRKLYPLAVKQQIQAAQKYNAAAMAYQMNYAARENYEGFGVKKEWGLYRKNAAFPNPDPQKDQEGFFFDWVSPPTALYLQDPGNPGWQNYIAKEFNRSVNEFGFDGMHLDQWGWSDNDYLYDYDGKERYFSKDYDALINHVKKSLAANNPEKDKVTFNMVGGNQHYADVPSPSTQTDFDYSEIWQDQDHYRDVMQVVEDTRAKNGGKAIVIAGYMNYKQATGDHYEISNVKGVPKAETFVSRIQQTPGWVGDFGKKDEDQIIWTVNVPEAGTYQLDLHYGHNNEASPEGRLSVNGEEAVSNVAFNEKTGWGNPVAVKTEKVQLKQGENEIKLQLNTNNLWLNVDSLFMSKDAFSKEYEAEYAELISSKVDKYGHVSYFETDGDYIEFTVQAQQAGTVPMFFSYGVERNSVERQLLINGEPLTESLLFESTGGWETFEHSAPLQVPLKVGENKIRLKINGINDTGVNIDSLTIGDFIYEAEKAVIGGDPSKTKGENRGSVQASSGYTDNFGIKGQQSIFEIQESKKAASFKIKYRSGNNPLINVLVDGQIAAENVAISSTPNGWSGGMVEKEIKVPLNAGKHSVTIEMASNGQYMNLDSLVVNEKEYQAEYATFAPENHGVQTTVGHVDSFDQTNDFITFHVNAKQAGKTDVAIRYANSNEEGRTMKRAVYVNGQKATDAAFASGDGWQTHVIPALLLNKGSNTLTLKVDEESDSGIKVDYVQIGAEKYEAEQADTLGPMYIYKDTLMNFGHEGDEVTFDVALEEAGETSFIFTYSNEGNETARTIYVDGKPVLDQNGKPYVVAFKPTNGANSYSEDGYVVLPHLEKGTHKITLKQEEGQKGTIQLRRMTTGYFDEPAVRLMDAGLAAAGATHIEIGTAEKIEEGPNMLAHEYYPNRSKKMKESLKESMKDYYKFFAAYENLLFDSQISDKQISVLQNGESLPLSQDGAKKTIWSIVRDNQYNKGYEEYEVVHLINLLNNDQNWRNAAAKPKLKKDLTVKVPMDKPYPNAKIYTASPEQKEGQMTKLTYTWEGNTAVIVLPSLEYWEMIVIDRDGENSEKPEKVKIK